jgi:Glyoxalase-like domain
MDRPPPSLWPGGDRSLVDQLCLDIPPGAFAVECAFWAALTGWERRSGSRPEFESLVRPPGMPLRLLLQRVGDEQVARGRAHLDLACDDVTAERRRHEALGATVVRTMPNWTTLLDPAGLAYCITCRDPGTGTL